MFERINEIMTAFMIKLSEARAHEEGQTSAEYVAVTAVAVAIALGVIYATLSGALTDAVTAIGDKVSDFVTTPGP